MSTARELLELAAKAAGLRIHVWGTPGAESIALMDDPKLSLWNPLTDDGDALRLAVKLDLIIKPWAVVYNTADPHGNIGVYERPDKMTGVRRAIVMAAAAIAQGAAQEGKTNG